MKRFFNWKESGSAFSLAVLWFANVWQEVIYSKSYFYYFAYNPVLKYSGMAIDVLLLTAVFLVLIKLSDFVSNIWIKRILQLAFLALGLGAFGGLSSELMKWISPHTKQFVNPLLPLIVLFLCGVFSVKQKFRLTTVSANLRVISLWLLPFAVLTCLQLCWLWFNTATENFLSKPAAETTKKITFSNQNPSSPKRVVWIIFDETDYRALSEAKKNKIDLPDIEKLLSESFVAANAFPPNSSTLESIPALLTGRTLKKTTPAASNDLILYPADDSAPLSLRYGDNLIAQLNNSGLKTGLVGWTHPYGRIFEGQLSAGYWSSIDLMQCSSLIGCSANIFRFSLLNVPLMTRLFPSLWFSTINNQIERNQFLTGKANELIVRPELDFLFFHFSIPHLPHIGRQNSLGGYFNSLELVNDTIRQLRETLEKNGQWDQTVLIISSDHFWRFKTLADFEFLPAEQRQAAVDDARIPFIIKLAGQKTRFDYQPPFNTVISRELILSVFKDEIKNSQDLSRWLDDLRVTRPELINFRPQKKRFSIQELSPD